MEDNRWEDVFPTRNQKVKIRVKPIFPLLEISLFEMVIIYELLSIIILIYF